MDWTDRQHLLLSQCVSVNYTSAILLEPTLHYKDQSGWQMAREKVNKLLVTNAVTFLSQEGITHNS